MAMSFPAKLGTEGKSTALVNKVLAECGLWGLREMASDLCSSGPSVSRASFSMCWPCLQQNWCLLAMPLLFGWEVVIRVRPRLFIKTLQYLILKLTSISVLCWLWSLPALSRVNWWNIGRELAELVILVLWITRGFLFPILPFWRILQALQ